MTFISLATGRNLSLVGAGFAAALVGLDLEGLNPQVAPASAASIASTNADRCSQMKGRRFGDAVVEEGSTVPKGAVLGKSFFSGPVTAPRNLCRVLAIASPVPGSTIKVEVWLPDEWNGKMLGTGGGGTNGGIISSTKEHAVGLERGYAGVLSDLGHDLSSQMKDWAFNQPERVVDFGHRGNHVAAILGKAIIADYYGKPATKSYFQGCSGGGREALMLAQRYPADYDGIIAGAPAANFSGLMLQGMWNTQRVHRIPGTEKLPEKVALLRAASVGKCDKNDGVADGVIENPLACKFDPEELQCKPGQDAAKCLTSAELVGVREIYGGAHRADGSRVFAGYPFGSEANWPPTIMEKGIVASMLAVPFYQWVVAQDPNFSPASFQLETGIILAKSRVSAITDATDPNLDAFVRRGGKLLIYHGWEDGLLPAGATIDYYASAKRRAKASLDRSVRLFMLPGVSHCEGGPGPSFFDKLDVLERWTERGLKPERIVAIKYENDALAKEGKPTKLVRTRPICPWPKVARYKGSGSTDDEANFSCAAP